VVVGVAFVVSVTRALVGLAAKSAESTLAESNHLIRIETQS
jgi:hypothetical protein